MNSKLHRYFVVALVLLLSNAVLSQNKSTAETVTSSHPVAYGLVIDNTDRKSIGRAIDIGNVFIKNNNPADEVFILRFTNSENLTVIQDFTSQKALLAEALDNMFAEGGAPAVLDAVHLSAEYLTQDERVNGLAQGRRALVLITHGADQGSYYRIENVLPMLREKSVKVYVIGLDAEEGARQSLAGFAKASGGRSYFPESGAEAEQATQEILADIRR